MLLDEGELDQAWLEAIDQTDDLPESRWHQLIDLRQPTHPEDVIEPWQRLIQHRLDASTDKYRYSKAITMLRRLRDAYRAIDYATGFDIYLDDLRERHKRKTSFIAKLDGLATAQAFHLELMIWRWQGATGLSIPAVADTGRLLVLAHFP
ncbi:hypothetical protein [Saccharopolyspora sp. NPDC003762]